MSAQLSVDAFSGTATREQTGLPSALSTDPGAVVIIWTDERRDILRVTDDQAPLRRRRSR